MTFYHHISVFVDNKDSERTKEKLLGFGLELSPEQKVSGGELLTLEISEEDPRWEEIKGSIQSLERMGRATDMKLTVPWEQEVRRLRELGRASKQSQRSELEWLEGYSHQTAEELLALEGKYRIDSLVLAFEQGIMQKVERDGVQTLTKEERVVLAVEALEREVNNGGYDQFFVNSSREFAATIVGALQRIGCRKTATITQRAIEALGTTDLTVESIEAIMAGDDEQRLTNFNRCDDSYYKSGEPIADRLFVFIKANKVNVRL
jgi:hypothetical protein